MAFVKTEEIFVSFDFMQNGSTKRVLRSFRNEKKTSLTIKTSAQ